MSQSFVDLEISLLNWEWPKSTDLPDTVALLGQSVCSGDFKDSLNSEIAKELLAVQSNASLEDTQASLANLFHFEVPSLPDSKEIEAVRLLIAVACLHAFLQENWTGPAVNIQISTILSTSISEDTLNTRSITELAYGGEPAYHLTKLPILLRLSQLLLNLPYQHLKTAKWWLRRSTAVHQLVLDEPVRFEVPKLEEVFDIASATSSDLAGQFILEEGLIYHHLGRDKEAYDCFAQSANIMGLEYEVTGALGVKTKYQNNPLSQLVLLARSRDRGGGGEANAKPSADKEDNSSTVPETLPLNDDTLLEETRFSKPSGESLGRLSDLDPSSQPPLHPLDQCVFLGMCLNVRNTSPAHGLTSEQMMPYVSRVISHPKNWSIHTMALLLRSRLEAHRTRTVERSTLQLQQLVEQMPTNDSSAKERLLYFHSLPLPSKWDLERELALRFMSLGVVKSALEVFERLEMWEEVIKCWGSIERPDKGIAIVQDLLAGRKQESEVATYRSKTSTSEKMEKLDSARESKLWCLLGDLEPQNAEKHYEKAWQISKETSGRAIRSLGGYYFARNNFQEAIRCLRLAVAINPLLSRSWFILGCACVREEIWKEARDAFARCVSIDDEDAESWSNLASVYLRLGIGDKEGEVEEESVSEEESSKGAQGSFDNKLLAFRALQRGLKFGHENWRMWTNYMIVAMDVGELSEATRALGRIVEQRADKDKEKSVDIEVLERLVDACGRTNGEEGGASIEPRYTKPNEGAALTRRVFDVIERTVLPRISTSHRIFRAYARLLMSQSRYREALEAHMNAYRLTCAGGTGTISTSEEWREGFVDVEEIIDVLKNLGPKVEDKQKVHTRVGLADGAIDSNATTIGLSGAKGWVMQARSIVRSFMGRTRRDFEDEPEFSRLEEMMEEIRGEGTGIE